MSTRPSPISLLLTLSFMAIAGWATWQIAVENLWAPSTEPRAVVARGRLGADELATIDLFRTVAPSVVHITTADLRRDRFTLNLLEIPRGSGSGFVWDEQGHVVTSYHVVAGAASSTVTLADRSTWRARVIGAAPDLDLAVLKVEAPLARLPPIPIGESAELEVGQKVFAIGNPFGLDQTLTTGIISALGREIESVTRRPIRDVIQTDAAINPGNSGGPLLDSAGRLIGVNAAIYSPSGAFSGIGFAIPADMVNWAVPRLIADGKIARPGLGITVAPAHVTRRWGISGILILNVRPGGGASEAGLRSTTRGASGEVRLGDVIVAIDDQPVSSFRDMARSLAGRKIGDRVRVTLADGRTLEIALSELE